jgi:hypothetical protein
MDLWFGGFVAIRAFELDKEHRRTSKSRDTVDKSPLKREQRELLSRKISELCLTIQGTQLEASIARLYKELKRAGIFFRPKAYLADEWGCPHGVPVIGIPFYLANPELRKLEGQLTGVEAEDEDEVLMCLRHEAGHAFNYAYRLYTKLEWHRLFGRFSRPYRDEYRPTPFSTRFVRHMPGWYAQKHPDEDFAETFAVWLTPGSRWRRRYADTPALAKLLYIDRVVRRYGRKPPFVTEGKLHSPVHELTMTLAEWYETARRMSQNKLTLSNGINEDLRRLFPETEGQPAAEILQDNGRRLIRDVNYWTGMNRNVLSSLFSELLERVRSLDLKVESRHKTARIATMAIFLTTLVMNHLCTGRFMEGDGTMAGRR